MQRESLIIKEGRKELAAAATMVTGGTQLNIGKKTRKAMPTFSPLYLVFSVHFPVGMKLINDTNE